MKKALAAEAKAAGICEDWYKHILQAQSKERLLALFFGGLDFVVDNDYPSEPLRREFDDIRRHYHIYEGEKFDVKNPRNLVAYKGALGTAEFSSFAVAQVWARTGSAVRICAHDNAVLRVDVAKGAAVIVQADGLARVSVFLHGGALQHQATGLARIKIINK